MYKIKIVSIGKNKESWLEQGIQEYVQRMRGTAAFEFAWLRNEQQLLELAQQDAAWIGLDEKGKQLSSAQFAPFLQSALERSGTRLTFFIGGADGLPAILKKADRLISLSPMTFTHQMVRLFLLEQIYRAFEITRGSPYHK